MAIETIYVFVQSIIYSLIIYSMIGFEWKLGKFLLFCYLVFMCFTYFTLYGMMVVALTPNYHIAAIVMSFFVGFWNLFTGFLIPRPVNDAQILDISIFDHFSNFSNSWLNQLFCRQSPYGGGGIIGLILWLGLYMAL